MVKRVGAVIIAALCSVIGQSVLASPSARAREQAKKAFEKGARYFEAQEYDAALPHFEKAYELSQGRPSTIRALAQCERALKKYGVAVLHFREYLATKPVPRDAAAIRETIRLIEDLTAEQEKESSAKSAGAPPPAPAPASPGLSSTPLSTPAPSPRTAVPSDSGGVVAPAASVPHGSAPAATGSEGPPPPNGGRTSAPPASDAPPPLPAPSPALSPPPPNVSAAPEPHARSGLAPPPKARSTARTTDDTGGLLESPIFWIATGIVAFGGAAALGLALTSGSPEPYGGTTGVILRRLEGGP